MATSKRISELKRLITEAPIKKGDAGATLAKGILFYLIAQSQLERAVVIDLQVGKDGTEDELAEARRAIHDMQSNNGSTRLSECMEQMGITFVFDTRSSEGRHFEFFVKPRNVILSAHFRNAYFVFNPHVTRGELDSIDFTKTGLPERELVTV